MFYIIEFSIFKYYIKIGVYIRYSKLSYFFINYYSRVNIKKEIKFNYYNKNKNSSNNNNSRNNGSSNNSRSNYNNRNNNRSNCNSRNNNNYN